jgi:hypothetical protein
MDDAPPAGAPQAESTPATDAPADGFPPPDDPPQAVRPSQPLLLLYLTPHTLQLEVQALLALPSAAGLTVETGDAPLPSSPPAETIPTLMSTLNDLLWHLNVLSASCALTQVWLPQ